MLRCSCEFWPVKSRWTMGLLCEDAIRCSGMAHTTNTQNCIHSAEREKAFNKTLRVFNQPADTVCANNSETQLRRPIMAPTEATRCDFFLCWSIDFFLVHSSAAYNRIFGLALTRAQSKYGQMLKEIRSALIMKNVKVKLAREWPSPIIDLKECSRRCQTNLNMKKPTFDMNLALTTANLSIFQFSFHTTRKEK